MFYQKVLLNCSYFLSIVNKQSAIFFLAQNNIELNFSFLMLHSLLGDLNLIIFDSQQKVNIVNSYFNGGWFKEKWTPPKSEEQIQLDVTP